MLSRVSQLLLSLHRGCREQQVGDYQDWALDQLKSVIYFDSALWLTGTLDKSHRATIHSLHTHRQPPEVVADWARVSQGRAVLTERVFNSPGVTFNCIAANEFCPELLAHSRRYNIEHLLVTTTVGPVSRLSELISLYRADPDKPFSEDERLTQQNIIPHLAETWHINRLQDMHLACQSACATVTHAAVADRQGVLHLIDPGFIELLQCEWPDWHGPVLPEELVHAMADNSERFAGDSVIVRLLASEGFIQLRGRKKSLLDNLSKREREVAIHFSSGRTNKEIAQLLDLAPATIRNHVHAIYFKLGINNKAALAAYMKEQS